MNPNPTLAPSDRFWMPKSSECGRPSWGSFFRGNLENIAGWSYSEWWWMIRVNRFCLFVAQDLWPIVRSAHGDFEPWRQQFGRENCKINWVSTQARSTCQHQRNFELRSWTHEILMLDGRPTFWHCSRLGQKIHSQRSWRTVAWYPISSSVPTWSNMI